MRTAWGGISELYARPIEGFPGEGLVRPENLGAVQIYLTIFNSE
jgi:hypothetical protein